MDLCIISPPKRQVCPKSAHSSPKALAVLFTLDVIASPLAVNADFALFFTGF
jgi:hypothetical protein